MSTSERDPLAVGATVTALMPGPPAKVHGKLLQQDGE